MDKDAFKLVIADRKGRIFSHPCLRAAGMKAGSFFSLKPDDLIKIPPGSQLFKLPHRAPVGLDTDTNRYVKLKDCFAVAAFIAPGYTVTYNSAYREGPGHNALPLYSYAACAFRNGRLHAAAIRVDRDRRHDSRFIDMALVQNNIPKLKKIFKKNRLILHLEKCALIYGCPNAQNFFLSRYEAPLPASPSCSSSCLGCISSQKDKGIRPSQPRIRFVPLPEEISEIALYHIKRSSDPIVSFGQGCEGEPLSVGSCIEKAIRLIRQKTSKGTVNINTNAGRPDVLSRLLDAGLDTVRVSLNSARPLYYNRYYRPTGYSFKDVRESMRRVKSKGAFISLNYLTMPGFTDLNEEAAAIKELIKDHHIDMIQWRNLNYDPVLYFRRLKLKAALSELIGVREVIESLKIEFPRLRMGYFNPRGAVSRRR